MNLRRHSSSEHPSRRPLNRREKHFQHSLRRLHSHPALTNAPQLESTQFQANQETLPSDVIQALFNDLVRRELGVTPKNTSNPTAEINIHLNQHLATSRAAAEKPSLSQPSFIQRLSTGHSTSNLGDKKIIEKVVEKPINATFHIPNAHQVHLAIQNARNEKNDRQKSNFKSVTNYEQGNDSNNILPETRIMTRRRARRGSLREHDNDLGQSARKKLRRSSRLEQRDTSSDFANSRTPSLPDDSQDLGHVTRSSRPKHGVSGPQSQCCFCPPPNLFNGKELGSELIGPFVDLQGRARLFVHFDCACWAPQVYAEPGTGQLKRVFEEYNRGRQLKCNDCGHRGATIGCYVQRCKKVFHFRCLQRAGACRVERFFVAFCKNHAKLSTKRSYQILMEAATIADVAAAQRREDTTFGLDAPHSRYTCLRRRETEVIFSKIWNVCSHPGVYENETVVFSHRRKLILGKHDALRASDRIQAIRKSVLDIATGKLAYASVAGKNLDQGPSSATEARAALNSRENTSLLLLRNLRKAPKWTKETIQYVKRLPMADVATTETTNALKESSQADPNPELPNMKTDKSQEMDPIKNMPTDEHEEGSTKPNWKDGCEVRESGENEEDKIKSNVKDTEMTKPNEDSPNLAKEDSQSHDKRASNETTGDTETQQGDEIEPSAPLPSFRRTFRRYKNKRTNQLQPETENVNNLVPTENITNAESEKTTERSIPEEVNLDAKRNDVTNEISNSVSPFKETNFDHVSVQNGESVIKKKKSAWEIFLDEHLPKERKLRPQDSEADALRNMARLWSLMSVKEREEYEKLSQLDANTNEGADGKEGIPNGGSTYVSHQSRGKGSSSLGSGKNATNVGFFRQRKQATNERKSSKPTSISEPSRMNRRPPTSVPLPRSRHAGRLRNGKTRDSEDEPMDWEKMFPVDINSTSFDASSDDGEAGIHENRRVRRPPRRNPNYD